MFRSASDAIDMFEVFKAAGVDLVLFDISNEPVSTGVGKLIMTILAAVADMERIRIKERTAEGRKAAKAKGRAVGNVPFGYRKVGQTAELEIDEGEMKAAAMMRDLYQDQISYPGIGKQLADAGLLSRAGKPYTPMAIRRVVMEAQQ
jgi:site-specific DNA recombinase